MNLPSYSFFPAPLWMLTALHILTLSLHLVAMNFMVGGVIIVLAGRFTDRWHDPTVRLVVKLLPSAMAATVSLGVAAERLRATGYADTRPIAGNDSEEGRARNRRVSLVIHVNQTKTETPSTTEAQVAASH